MFQYLLSDVSPRTAFQTPEHVPKGIRPRHVPAPRPPESRPDPWAVWGPAETLMLTWPEGDTRPETLTNPPKEEMEPLRTIKACR